MTFFDPDANSVINFGQMTCTGVPHSVLHVLCLTRTSGSWLTIPPSSFNLNWFVLFRAASGCNLFAFHRSCAIIHFHRRFSLLTKPQTGKRRSVEVEPGWRTGSVAEGEGYRPPSLQLESAGLIWNCWLPLILSKHSSWRECPSAFLVYWKKVSIIWALLPTGTLCLFSLSSY